MGILNGCAKTATTNKQRIASSNIPICKEVNTMIGFWVGVIGCALATVLLFALSVCMCANKGFRVIGTVGVLFAIFYLMVIVWTICNANKIMAIL